jgi:hypothetical protein
MTPASVLAAIPYGLLRRRPNPSDQLANVKELADWLLDKGHRPSLFEIEQERTRRAPTKTNPRPHHERKARP